MTEYVSKYLEANGIAFTAEQCEILSAYLSRLLEVNKTMNLTAIREPEEAALKHIADSAVIVKYLKSGTLIDIGSGGGLPAFPIAILRPDVTVLALDSTKKKTDFISQTAVDLSISNLSAICGRAEELAFTDMRESFDNVTARAVAEMRVLSELALPFAKKGGRFVAMKGKIGADETIAAKNGIQILGGSSPRIIAYGLLGGSEPQSRVISVTEKIKTTPNTYPRPYAKITKRPL